MALSRRSGQKFQTSIWPGFVDAMTALLLVLMFVLTIFMVVQFVLRETISGQESQLDDLGAKVLSLADALGVEQQRSDQLDSQLNDAQSVADQQLKLIASLTATSASQANELAQQRSDISDFEAQVASLLGQGETLRAEIDSQNEQAALAKAQRAALEAMVADLNKEAANQDNQLATALTRLQENQAQLSDEEAKRLAQAAAAEALRERLKNADTELTAMTLALEAQRKKAEDTLTLLAAASTDKASVAAQSQELLSIAQKRATLLAIAKQALATEKERSNEDQRKLALLNEQIATLRGQLASLQEVLDAYSKADSSSDVRLQVLGSQLNAALARVASEQKRRVALEEADRVRLEAEKARLESKAKDLESYKSEFFGQLRNVLQNEKGVRIEGDRFVFSSEVLFQTGDATLSRAGRKQIANIAAILKRVSDEIPSEIDWVIRVDGHTDNRPLSGRGRFKDNWELSQARSLSVVRYMHENLGIAPHRLAANGFGEYRPINPSNSRAARAQNRRIELKLTER